MLDQKQRNIVSDWAKFLLWGMLVNDSGCKLAAQAAGSGPVRRRSLSSKLRRAEMPKISWCNTEKGIQRNRPHGVDLSLVPSTGPGISSFSDVSRRGLDRFALCPTSCGQRQG